MSSTAAWQSDRLVREIGPGSSPARDLLDALQEQQLARGARDRARWEAFWADAGFPCAPAADEALRLFAVESYVHLVLALFAERFRSALLGGADRPELSEALGPERGFGRRLARLLRAQPFREAGVRGLLEPALFMWPAEAPTRATIRAIRRLAAALNGRPWGPLGPTEDLFGPLHLALVPRARRRATGAFYTPSWLVELVLDRVGLPAPEQGPVLDPTCGSGTFLAHVLHRRGDLGGADAIRGIELSPLAVSTARLRCLAALGRGRPGGVGEVDLRQTVVWGDALFGPVDGESLTPTGSWSGFGRAACVVGNPPWVNWEQLSEAKREAIKHHDGGYARWLFPHRGLTARSGGAHDDLAGLITYAVADRLLEPGGRLGLVLPLSLLRSVRGGEGFRRFSLPGRWALGVERVDDLSRLKPFPASGRAAVLTAVRDAETRYPLPYLRWVPRGRTRREPGDLAEVRGRCALSEEVAAPVDPEERSSPWLTSRAELQEPLRSVAGVSPHRARKGVDTSLNAVFWVRVLSAEGSLVRVVNAQTRSRTFVEPREALLERSVLFPLLRGRDFDRWRAALPFHQLLLYDRTTGRPLSEEDAAATCPRALAYLRDYEGALRDRRIYRVHLQRRPFYSCYDIGPYSFAPYKVVWKALASGVRAAVVGAVDDRPVVPDHNVVLVGFEEPDAAHFLCGVLNSRLCTRFADAYTGWFYSVHLLQRFRAPGYDAAVPLHREISALSRRAHRASSADLGAMEETLEQRVRELDGFRSWRAAAQEDQRT